VRRIDSPLLIVVLALSLAVPAVSSARAEATVRGRVLAGPTCPVERPGDPACAPRPVVAAITVSTPGGRVIRTIRSSASGRFTLTLARGAYLLKPRALSGALPVGRAVRIHVRAGRITRVVLSMDTGIR
jgi:hypothetical protein